MGKDLKTLPLLPLRDIIVFPYSVVPLFVGRDSSIQALESAMKTDKHLFVSVQKRAKTHNPSENDLYKIGIIIKIIQLLRLPDGNVKVIVEGIERAEIYQYVETQPFLIVECATISEEVLATKDELLELIDNARKVFENYAKLNKRISKETLERLQKIDDPTRLADIIASKFSLKIKDRQIILEIGHPDERLKKLIEFMSSEIENLQVEKKIRSKVKRQTEHTRQEYYLNEKKQKSSSSSGDESTNEIEELQENIDEKDMSEEAKKRLLKELKRLKMMNPMSSEATVVRNYIDWVLALPWKECTEIEIDITRANEILEADHYGLKKPKERILEYLSVHKLVEKLRGPVLCLVGPPGVGKTSLARSIARSTGRNFIRLSLGGVRDEAEIRGHRRTYVGALPGKIIQSLRKAESNNPVFLLDEIDKMSMDFRGDPSSALLEVLDPEQNFAFNDHFLELDYDLSEIMFITTANASSKIPHPLLDRMEIIELPGYMEEEKLQIARDYLVPKQIKENGISKLEVVFSDLSVRKIITRFTKEAGVRNLERNISSICRKIAKDFVQNGPGNTYRITTKKVLEYLGPYKYKEDEIRETDEVGVTNGLAWTIFGGVLLTSEVTLMPGVGKLIITGKLGDVMQESAQAAMSYVRSRAMNLGLAPDFYQKVDLHVHFPEGAAPKDGPSAGITMVTSIVSALTRIPVKRDLAMTGEITLRGLVLPIGGLKEKILAAFRAGAKTIVIPHENEKDLYEVPKDILKTLSIIPVKHMDEVLKTALVHEDPEMFMAKLSEPILPPDIRYVEHVEK